MTTRPWQPPARHWPDRPEVVAGLDETAGGSWLGLNDYGVAAAALNRVASLGPAAGKRSRGELVLEALDHADAAAAAQALAAIDPRAYRPFNLVIADNRDALVVINRGEDEPIQLKPLAPGLSMVTAHDPNDEQSPRIRRYRPLFTDAPPPDPDTGTLGPWEALLAATESGGEGPSGAMRIVDMGAFATSSSAVIALPAPLMPPREPLFLFANGAPGAAPFRPVAA